MNQPVFKPDLDAAPWRAYAKVARERWGTASPFRLGYVAGLAGERRVCPYSVARTRASYLNGYMDGSADRKAQPVTGQEGTT
jgi:ribosome modulation factor